MLIINIKKKLSYLFVFFAGDVNSVEIYLQMWNENASTVRIYLDAFNMVERELNINISAKYRKCKVQFIFYYLQKSV